MKIYKLAIPLPLGEVPESYGEEQVDLRLLEDEIAFLEDKYRVKEKLGGGMWGVAYLTEDDKVLKITCDEKEYALSNTLKDSGGYDGFADVYETGELSDNVYYILKEKVRPLTEEERHLFLTLIGVYEGDDEKMIEGDGITDEIEKNRLEDFATYIYHAYNYIGVFDDMFNVENIGYDKDNQLVCFDFTKFNF